MPEEKKTIRFDVFLDSGVSVEVPAGTDPETDAGYESIKAAAQAKFQAMLRGGGWDANIEPYEG